FTGNTLNLMTDAPVTVYELRNFQYLNFTLPANITPSSSPMLTITGNNGLDYGGSGVALDLRAPAGMSPGTLADGDYILLRTDDDTQALADISKYSLYDEELTGTGDRALTLTTGRVRGNFKISLDNSDKDLVLTVDNYQAPNTTLTWKGTVDNQWTNYSTNTSKSPENWYGADPLNGNIPAALRYLDGDTVIFDDTASVFAVTLDRNGVTPDALIFANDTQDYTITGDPGSAITVVSRLEKKGQGAVTLDSDLDARGAALDFYLPVTWTASSPALLTVTGTANVTGSAVNVGIDGASSPLAAGDSVTLIDARALVGAPVNSAANGVGMLGVSLSYEFDITTDSNQRLLATVRSAGGSGNPINPRAKALSEGFIAGTAFLNQGADFIVDEGFAAVLRAQPKTAHASIHGFAAIGGGSLRHKTGSHVDVDGYTLLAGIAATPATTAGDLTLGAFIEHGEGDYDTYNSFANAASARGKGDADYTGGGLLARLKFAENERGHLYTEASARLGKVNLEFRTYDLIDAFGRRAAYDSDSRYASAHAGLGYLWRLNAQSSLKLYGQYLWSRQGSDTVKLTTGEPVKFQAVDSQRARLGARWSQNVSASASAYLGAAWEHEFDGKAKASIHGYRLAAPDLKGDTGMLEAGFTLNPTATKPLTLDIGIQGYAGKREGVTGSVRANYRF
ncbi:MAG: autotransporter outer membrane beta-barrel domain-containing protein, partial [Zoogloeaceae bacterium]|nr:autotransporter outer membrane beta-barrel domain-containing protein [Zoogloeaceae bacterium]